MKKSLTILLACSIILTFCSCTKSVNSSLSNQAPKNESDTNESSEIIEFSASDEEISTAESSYSIESNEPSVEPESETSPDVETECTTEAPTAQTQAPTAQTQVPTTQHQTQAPTKQNQSATQPATQTVTEAATARYIVDYTEESSSKTETYKYGILKLTTTTNYYKVYSDGSREKYYTGTNSTYDTSGYNATDSELLNESNTKAAANMSYYNEVLTLVNEIRAEAGVQPLTLDTTLCQAATMRAVEMDYSNLFSHTRPDGSSCFSIFNTYPVSCSWYGENIAAGYGSPQEVVTGWKNSPGHYANMTDAGFTKLGVGMSSEGIGSYGIYWVQLFTN